MRGWGDKETAALRKPTVHRESGQAATDWRLNVMQKPLCAKQVAENDLPRRPGDLNMNVYLCSLLKMQ